MTSPSSKTSRKVVVLCPFWQQQGNAGFPRIERYVRWLADAGAQVCVICAGSSDRTVRQPWGCELVIKDPAKLYPDALSERTASSGTTRKPNRLRRWLAYQLYSPDPTIIWSKRVARHPSVTDVCRSATHILSSSPPESTHLAARALAQRHELQWIMDMRDGWLDEPLRPALTRSALRRWREARLERQCLQLSHQIVVSSNAWQTLLRTRYPEQVANIRVITNAYPLSERQPDQQALAQAAPTTLPHLVYAGKFSGSDPRRQAGKLLQPLLDALGATQSRGVVRLIGSYTESDRRCFEALAPAYAQQQWQLEQLEPVPRAELLVQLGAANGLLLLSTSGAALPAKLFEYLPTGLPVLLAAAPGSAAWQLCEPLAQVHRLALDAAPDQQQRTAAAFLASVLRREQFEAPAELHDAFIGVKIKSLLQA
ncbi:MAG: glycosyltransferase [Pseudomonadales bacterium]